MSLPSAEVAADFKDALQDLKTNSRPEISNLTIIAKENTEHAQAISRELENHIKIVSSSHMLFGIGRIFTLTTATGAKTDCARPDLNGNSRHFTCSTRLSKMLARRIQSTLAEISTEPSWMLTLS